MIDKLEALIQQWTKDAHMDQIDLDKETTKIPELHGKYMKLMIETRPLLKTLEARKYELRRILYEYYKGDLNEPDKLKEIKRPPWRRKLLRTDLTLYVEGDPEMCTLIQKIGYYEEYIETCREILKQINNRQWLIKNILEYRKLTQFTDDS